MTEDLFKRYRRALGLGWKSPPTPASDAARRRPPGEPTAPPDEGSSVAPLSPRDIRTAGVDEAQAMISRSLAGVDITILVTPPSGDGLWTLEGRAWRNPSGDEPIHVVLALGDHVAGEETVAPGERFRFQELLTGAWTLEFHLGDRIAMLQGPEPA